MRRAAFASDPDCSSPRHVAQARAAPGRRDGPAGGGRECRRGCARSRHRRPRARRGAQAPLRGAGGRGEPGRRRPGARAAGDWTRPRPRRHGRQGPGSRERHPQIQKGRRQPAAAAAASAAASSLQHYGQGEDGEPASAAAATPAAATPARQRDRTRQAPSAQGQGQRGHGRQGPWRHGRQRRADAVETGGSSHRAAIEPPPRRWPRTR